MASMVISNSSFNSSREIPKGGIKTTTSPKGLKIAPNFLAAKIT